MIATTSFRPIDRGDQRLEDDFWLDAQRKRRLQPVGLRARIVLIFEHLERDLARSAATIALVPLVFFA
ncbi:MAG: hypothetical protein U0232_10040 [Thermomicrobiales bacterium]